MVTIGDFAHTWLGLDTKIPFHGVVVSSAHLNVVHIHVAIEQCHGSSRSQGYVYDLSCINASAMHAQTHGVAQHLHDVLDLDQRSSRTEVVGH
jgi:hypothetical protein